MDLKANFGAIADREWRRLLIQRSAGRYAFRTESAARQVHPRQSQNLREKHGRIAYSDPAKASERTREWENSWARTQRPNIFRMMAHSPSYFGTILTGSAARYPPQGANSIRSADLAIRAPDLCEGAL